MKQTILAELSRAMAEASVASNGRVAMRELPCLTQVNFRADPLASGVMDAVRRGLGFALPEVPNSTSSGEGRWALWLGPNEWLIVGPEGEAARLELALRSALGDTFGAVVDVSASRIVIELQGLQARDLLAHGCSLDLHPRRFGPGRCAQTLLAKAQVIIQPIDETPTFYLYARSSFACYVVEWLLDGATDY